MRKLLISALVAVFSLSQLGAVEVYKVGDKSVSVFGEINVGIGYGNTLDYPITISNGKSNYSIQDAYNKTKHSFMLGIQRDSRIGIGFNVSGLFGEATLGLGSYSISTNIVDYGEIPYFRQLYAGYDFGVGGRILAGKIELNTSMGGFISDIANEEYGLWGYGAPRNSVRRLQMRYEIAGFSIGISMNDANQNTTNATDYEARILYTKRSIPKISLAYEYNSDRLRAKIAGSYVCAGHCNNSKQNATKSKHIAYITAGIKPYFGKSYLSFVLSYGLNSHYTGDSLVSYGAYINQNLTKYGNLYYLFNSSGLYGNSNLYDITNYDRNIYATALEFGHNFTDKVALKIGLGYQIATSYDRFYSKYDILHSFGGFIQVPCKINDYFTLIPQIGGRVILREDIRDTNANEYKFDFNANAMALLLMKFTF